MDAVAVVAEVINQGLASNSGRSNFHPDAAAAAACANHSIRQHRQ